MKPLIIIILVIISFCAGIFFAISTTPQVDVSWTEQDYESYLAKIGAIAPVNAASGDAGNDGQSSSEGQGSTTVLIEEKAFPVNASFTNAEISAMVSKECALAPNSLVKDVKIKFLPDNRLEASFVTTDKLKELIPAAEREKFKIAENLISNRSVYLKMKLEKTSAKTISLDLENAKVGLIKVPAEALKVADGVIESAVNNRLQELTNFSIDDFSFSDNNASFKGNLQSTPRALK